MRQPSNDISSSAVCETLVRDHLLVLFVTAAATYLLAGPVRKFAIKVRAIPEIRARDVHPEPVPRLGGIAVFLGLCAGLLVAGRLTGLSAASDTFDQSRALLSGAVLIWLCGVLDDKFLLSSLIMLGGQITAASAMVMQGMTILWLPVPGVGTVELPQWQGALLTVFLVVVTISAVNFVDGLDGLATGMVFLTAIAFCLFAYRVRASNGIESAAPATLFAAILMGMCLGFLPHNVHPARIFLGNSGSMLLGLVLAAGTVSMTGQVDPDTLKPLAGSEDAAVREMLPVYLPLLLPLFIIAFHAADLALVIVSRTRKDRLPYATDRGHLHHRLLEIGDSHHRAVLIAYAWSALVASGTLAYAARDGFMWVMLGIVVLSAVGLLSLLLRTRFKRRAPRWRESVVPVRYRRRRAGHARPPRQPLTGSEDLGATGTGAGWAPAPDPTQVRVLLELADDASHITFRLAPGKDHPWAASGKRARALDVVAIPLTSADVEPSTARHTHPNPTRFAFTPHRPGNHVIRFTLYDQASGTVLQQVETELDITPTTPGPSLGGVVPLRTAPGRTAPWRTESADRRP